MSRRALRCDSVHCAVSHTPQHLQSVGAAPRQVRAKATAWRSLLSCSAEPAPSPLCAAPALASVSGLPKKEVSMASTRAATHSTKGQAEANHVDHAGQARFLLNAASLESFPRDRETGAPRGASYSLLAAPPPLLPTTASRTPSLRCDKHWQEWLAGELFPLLPSMD